mmetsp:Transcript_49252/g.59403  ORF Transcript_49252/g.59403 Transcript_49252/m.59403 type:complete len:119 (+) Transcript_49252:10-366(+)
MLTGLYLVCGSFVVLLVIYLFETQLLIQFFDNLLLRKENKQKSLLVHNVILCSHSPSHLFPHHYPIHTPYTDTCSAKSFVNVSFDQKSRIYCLSFPITSVADKILKTEIENHSHTGNI